MDKLKALRHFIGASQDAAIGAALRGEEGQFFRDKLDEIAEIIRAMPTTYGTRCAGMNAVVYLHYFLRGADWYITETDVGAPDDEEPGVQHQAFGLADLFGDGGELGYISIAELIENGAELDLYWTPRTLREVLEEKRA